MASLQRTRFHNTIEANAKMERFKDLSRSLSDRTQGEVRALFGALRKEAGEERAKLAEWYRRNDVANRANVLACFTGAGVVIGFSAGGLIGAAVGGIAEVVTKGPIWEGVSIGLKAGVELGTVLGGGVGVMGGVVEVSMD